ncbi:MAG: hypothetical protein A1D16_19530 [Flavihumibacter sp. CACIAM 22H1]|nr:MAG: hypothetical protein A1D16_19530 [Flavihumibacter sp. CACIAM 22H1]
MLKAWRVLAGVQGDVLFRGRERMDYIDETVTVTDRTRDFDFGYTGGFEASISPRFTVMARYIHGIQDVSPTSNVNTAMNQAVQATVNFYLCKPGAKKAKNNFSPTGKIPSANGRGDFLCARLLAIFAASGIKTRQLCKKIFPLNFAPPKPPAIRPSQP